MEKEPKIQLRYLNWAYSLETGVLPFIFNKSNTAIKVYCEKNNEKVLPLEDNNKSEILKALSALYQEFDTKFTTKITSGIIKHAFSPLETHIRHKMNEGFDNIKLSRNDIERIRKNYNKKIFQEAKKQAKIDRKVREEQEEQESLLNF